MADIEHADIDGTVWPTNILFVLAVAIEQEMPEIEAIAFRPLTPSDPSMSVSCFSTNWTADEWVVGGRGVPELAHYDVTIELQIKGPERAYVRAQVSELSKKLRTMLYSSEVLSVLFAGLTDESFGVIERFQRMKVVGQAQNSGSPDGAFMAMSKTTLIIETENVQT